MKIMPGKPAENQKQAATLAFQAAGAKDMSAGISDMFASLGNDQRIGNEADKAIGTAIRSRYGSKAT